MKTRNFLWSLLACAAFSACSSDEVDNTTKEFKDKAYMRVKIAMAGDPSSRGTSGANDYEYGTTTEQPVKNLLFMFYNADGSFATVGTSVENPEVTPNTSVDGTPDGNIEAVTNPVISLELLEGSPLPTQVIAFVNVGIAPDIVNQLKNKNLSEVQELLTGINASLKVLDFPMTSSTYVDDENNVKIATPVAEDCFYETEAAALASKKMVTIHVERLPVKVKVVEPESTNIKDVETANGKYLKFTLKGFELNGTNANSYLLKNVDGSWKSTGKIPNTSETAESTSNTWNGWTNPTDYRCFWAKDFNYTVDTAPGLSYVTGSKLTGGKEAKYCYENTMTLPLAEDGNLYEHATHVLVYGNYSVVDSEGSEVDGYKNDDDTIKDLFMYTGSLYLANDLKTMWANDITDIYVQSEEDYVKAGPDNYELISDETVEGAILGFMEGTTYYKKSGEEYVAYTTDELTAKKTALAEIYKATGYKAGLAYFPILIEHFGISNDTSEGPNKYDTTTELGVVRNHIYEITINKIEGLGEGVFNPNEEIIPNSSIKTWYLASKLNILSWKTVKQDVDL